MKISNCSFEFLGNETILPFLSAIIRDVQHQTKGQKVTNNSRIKSDEHQRVGEFFFTESRRGEEGRTFGLIEDKPSTLPREPGTIALGATARDRTTMKLREPDTVVESQRSARRPQHSEKE